MAGPEAETGRADPDVEAVLDFLRKNGLRDAEMWEEGGGAVERFEIEFWVTVGRMSLVSFGVFYQILKSIWTSFQHRQANSETSSDRSSSHFGTARDLPRFRYAKMTPYWYDEKE
ncbi:hypothetical protein NC653_019793 [Populus alba x Populus x berolinensis]|uniref:Uncharacterized protein n=1 Tax=Populus alba x Populus x berolinensis TaxID=444605 RepID=A0AAD6QD28_9ROSI|nr:hypothetical protein NC653_019793 [Populus alba x Populus x berolinensis]